MKSSDTDEIHGIFLTVAPRSGLKGSLLHSPVGCHLQVVLLCIPGEVYKHLQQWKTPHHCLGLAAFVLVTGYSSFSTETSQPGAPASAYLVQSAQGQAVLLKLEIPFSCGGVEKTSLKTKST